MKNNNLKEWILEDIVHLNYLKKKLHLFKIKKNKKMIKMQYKY